jgi:hypothetical protein
LKTPGAARPDPEGFLASTRAAFQEAGNLFGARTKSFAIAGAVVRVSCAGDNSERFLRALGHRTAQGERPADLTICAWDSSAGDGKFPQMPWSRGDIREQGQVSGYNTDRFATNFNIDSLTLTMVDLAEGNGIWWRPVSDPLPLYERAAPLRHIFNAWFEARGKHFVHSAAVGGEDGCILLAGGGGCGKSTTALACALRGMDYIADDYLLLSGEGDNLAAHNVYCSAKVSDNSLRLLPRLEENISNPEEGDIEKSLIFVDELQRFRLADRRPVKAIVVPRVSGEKRSAIAPLSPARALMALGPSTVFQQPGTGEARLRYLSRVVRTTLCFELSAGNDMLELCGLVRSFLAGRQ